MKFVKKSFLYESVGVSDGGIGLCHCGIYYHYNRSV